MKFIICARSKTDSEIELWRTAASRVVPIPTCWLIGWEQPLYQHVLDQHYTSSISVNRAILLGASLFELAESTSNYVKGPISVVISRRQKAMLVGDEKKVKELENMVGEVGTEVDSLLLVAADRNEPSVFEGKFREVQKSILAVRSRYEHISLEDSISGTAIIRQPRPIITATGIVTAHATPPTSKHNKRKRTTSH